MFDIVTEVDTESPGTALRFWYAKSKALALTSDGATGTCPVDMGR